MKERLWMPEWVKQYRRDWLSGDLSAGLIVSVMLIPQSLAYALLAGLPPQVGLYASVLPLVAYALLGSSMTLAVGPVAIISLMTASALTPLAVAGSDEYVVLAMMLALMSGVLLFIAGVMRLGFLAYFLSHSVISGFISGTAILITLGQLKYLLGMPLPSGSALGMVAALPTALQRMNPSAATMGISAIVFLIFARTGLPPILNMLGVAPRVGAMLSRLAPMLAIIVATTYCAMNQIDQTAQVSIVGAVPSGLPALTLPSIDINALQALALPALLISLVGFVESVSVAQSLALKRGERISPNKELMGIGVANVASAVSGGFPVTGGFARSVVNYDAGAHSPGAGIVSAIIMSVVIVAFTGWFYYLPHAVLAATIIVAVLTLVDFKTVITTWRYDKADAVAMLLTFAGVLLLGVEEGILLGVALSLAVLVWRSSHPHMAVVGRVPNTEHFRNIDRHEVATLPGLIALRVDESLYFANAQIVEAKIEQLVQEQPKTRCVLLIMSAVNQLDTTALQMLTELEASLSARGIRLQFAEVKGPVLDKLQFSALGQRMRERIFLSTHQAFNAFANEKAMH